MSTSGDSRWPEFDDFESHMMSRGTEDPVTHTARLYEATRLPDLAVQIES